jgi:hypothetical protein
MTEPPEQHAGRLRAMRILAVVMAVFGIGFGLLTIAFGILSPEQEPHAFHNAVVAALLIVISAPPVIRVARAPERPTRPLVILAVIGAAALVTMALSLTLDPFTLPFVVLVGVLWALAPRRDELVPRGQPSLLVAAVSVVAAVTLIPYALGQAELQRTDDTSEHAAFFHWVEMSFYAAAIPLLGLLTAVRPRAYRLAGWCAGVALIVIGAASVLLADYPSALAAPLSWVALAAGVALVAVTELAARDG